MKIIALLFLAFANITILYAQKSFGFLYNIQAKQTNVETVFKNGPADKAGMQKGDIITSLNSNNLAGLNLDEVSKLFGEANDNSIISLKRNGTAINDVKISRADRSSFLNVCVSGNCQNGEGEFIDLNGHKYTGSFSNGKKSGYGKMNYVGNSVYNGNWANDKPTGKGKIVLENGNTYEGDFVNGLFEGQGIYTLYNGETYTGTFAASKFHGTIKHKLNEATFIEVYKAGERVSSKNEEPASPGVTAPAINTTEALLELNKFLSSFDNGYYGNVEIKDGYWFTNFKTGTYCKAKMSDLDVAVVQLTENSVVLKCKGDIKCIFSTWNNEYYAYSHFRTGTDFDKVALAKLINDVLDSYNGVSNRPVITGGKGNQPSIQKQSITYPSGDVYEGYTLNGVPHGKGKLVYANGNVYDGDFVNGQTDGYGTLTFKIGHVYSGQFAAGFRNGKGKIQYADGNIYEGDWVNDKIEGQGIYTFKVGGVYTGTFAKGERNGKGKYSSASGQVYEGDWDNGKKEGQGTQTFPDGRIYTGQFANNKYNGKGKFLFISGDIYEGDWVNDKREGKGTYTKKDGSYYTGEWKDDKINGYGKQYNKVTGKMQEGKWKDGVFVD